jgi:HD-GYP domain-containing protein (c-di-GMP phosphodiesterase class II)
MATDFGTASRGEGRRAVSRYPAPRTARCEAGSAQARTAMWPAAWDQSVAARVQVRVARVFAMLPSLLADDRTGRRAAECLAGLLRAYEPATADHCLHARYLAARLGQALRLPAAEQRALELGALLHDVGKLAMPLPVLLTAAPLSPAEWLSVRAHPVDGARMVAHLPRLAALAPIILHHHERWDGGGYPHGLAGTAIPLPARLVALADAYATLRAGRPYRRPCEGEEALAEIRRGLGTQFDPALGALLPVLASLDCLAA